MLVETPRGVVAVSTAGLTEEQRAAVADLVRRVVQALQAAPPERR